MTGYSEFVVRNYNPDIRTDFFAVRENLGDRYVETQDGEDKLREYAARLPSSILVCEDTRSGEVVGNICPTDSPEPAFIAREAVSPRLGPETAREVTGVLVAATINELRSRGHQKAWLLYDDADRRTQRWQEYGFRKVKSCSSYVRPFWTPKGVPIPDIESRDPRMVARAYDPDTDFEALTFHLQHERRLTHLDTEELLRARVGRLSTAMAVVPDPDNPASIIGSMRMPDGPIPLLLEPVTETGTQMSAIATALYLFGCAARRQLGFRQVERLSRRNDPYVGHGFHETWKLFRAELSLAAA